ncbi:glycosyltransferase family 2 protein [Aquiflexum gelatinilyticum]|uniref:glycosyltransferase family 2 protein n=1 Tax=Aquiflexum gelatinilyticum TaxID=2961943 RepID=UPI002166D774|nr:glycosyltransferase family 2 protein [Aquiflexum gelatinilyticum]
MIIPVFNRENFIKNCVSSVLKLPQVGEVILVDDGSSDRSYLICEELSRANSKVKILTHPDRLNKGVSASRNLGIRHANFEFISFLDSDDIYLSNRFETDEKIFSNNTDAHVAYSLSQIETEKGKKTPFGTTYDTSSIQSQGDFYKLILQNEIILGHISSVTFRKIVFENLNKWFDERLQLHEDTELWNRISRKYFFFSSQLQKPVSIYYQHQLNTISARSMQSELKFLLVFIDNIGLKNLFVFEKKYIIYHFSRVFSNPIKNSFIRRLVLHGSQIFLNLFRNIFVSIYFTFGKRFLGLSR